MMARTEVGTPTARQEEIEQMRHLRTITRQNPDKAQYTDVLNILSILASFLSLLSRIFEIAGITPMEKLR